MNKLIKTSLSSALLSLLALTGCQQADEPNTKTVPVESASVQSEVKQQPAPEQVAVQDNFEQVYQGIDLADFQNMVKTLSSDEFAGREPATEGGRKTTAYISEKFKQLGLEPGNGDSFLQQVPLLSIEASPDIQLSIGDSQLSYGKDFVGNTSKASKVVQLKGSPLVFVGYGVVAPEYNWNDYAGLDMKGKTAVILVNDPGYGSQDDDLFQGKTMTYYGRWTYKYEEAARQGAAGAIIIHDTAPASYGWNVVSNSWSGAQYQLANAGSAAKVDVEMWITKEQAKDLFARSDLDLGELSQQALNRDFKAVALTEKASVTINSTIKESSSANVIATIKGTETPDEHIIYMAHWDHLGTRSRSEGEQAEDHVFNGAIDNATGTAAIISMAKAFKDLNIQPKRSITFMALTAEEQGLLGSKHFAANPTIAMNKIIGAFNIDSMNVSGRVKDLTVVGFGKSQLEEYMTRAAASQGRTTTSEASPERGGYYRSDHFSFAKQGVPAIFAGGGSDYLAEDAEEAAAWNQMRGKCYHQLCDEYQADWNWQATLQDIQVFFEAGNILANDGQYPNWYPSAEFKAVRDASLKQ